MDQDGLVLGLHRFGRGLQSVQDVLSRGATTILQGDVGVVNAILAHLAALVAPRDHAALLEGVGPDNCGHSAVLQELDEAVARRLLAGLLARKRHTARGSRGGGSRTIAFAAGPLHDPLVGPRLGLVQVHAPDAVRRRRRFAAAGKGGICGRIDILANLAFLLEREPPRLGQGEHVLDRVRVRVNSRGRGIRGDHHSPRDQPRRIKDVDHAPVPLARPCH
mmetsp:Transcript_78454/g.227738  ORF Transcript_78454/g.227738 Transcript_78454/m.227738 type:complete len:220 (+) Transcript_78454:352-1011(+)